MRGMGQIDAIETLTFRHAEGNEGKKNGVKRGNRGFFGAKLLKRQGQISVVRRQFLAPLSGLLDGLLLLEKP